MKVLVGNPVVPTQRDPSATTPLTVVLTPSVPVAALRVPLVKIVAVGPTVTEGATRPMPPPLVERIVPSTWMGPSVSAMTMLINGAFRPGP